MNPQLRKLAGIPVAVVHRATPCVWKIKPNAQAVLKSGDHVNLPLCFVAQEVEVPMIEWKKGIKLHGPPPVSQYFDGQIVREYFMKLRTEQQFLDFLNQFGRFSPLWEAEQSRGWRMKDFTGCQEMVAELAKRSPENWGEYANRLVSPKSPVGLGMLRAIELSARHAITFHWHGIPQVRWSGAKYIAVIEAENVISAILATIQVDHLRGAKFGVCARHDCPNFFKITSRHKRKYCSQPCAHLESLRRMRRRQRKETSKSRIQASKSRAKAYSEHYPPETPGRGVDKGKLPP